MRQNLSGSTGMEGEAWAAGAEPSTCTEMAPHVVVVCSTCQPRPAAGDGWTLSISGDKVCRLHFNG